MTQRMFGGDWTQEKLERIQKYLAAYTTIMQKQQHLRFAYIDAFAGTGYRTLKQGGPTGELLFPEFAEPEQRFLDGSARIALRVKPPFDHYFFVEHDHKRFKELGNLKTEFAGLADKITLVNKDANDFISELCGRYSWKSHRAVLFLDPFGMQVSWATIEAIAATRAIDLWYLFPLGVAVNRLLTKDGDINDRLRKRLDYVFGETQWFDMFYSASTDLFGPRPAAKTADFDTIARYFVQRLKTVFPHVAEDPLRLFNSRNVPLYLLCFAASNPRGGATAVKIAQHILSQ